MDDLRASSTVAEYFHDVVTTALKNQGLSVADVTEFYIVNLLSDYAHASPPSGTSKGSIEEPLAIKLCQAAQAPSFDERLRLLKDVGDESLYLSGFFAESLSRRLVDVDYYIDLGGTAYGQAASLMKGAPGGDRFGLVFAELAEKFPRLVDILSEISGRADLTSESGILRLYERWVRTKSGWIERKLKARGLLPGKGPGYVQ